MRETTIIIGMAVIFSLFIANFTAVRTYKLSAFDLELDVGLTTEPETRINFPPVGTISAVTHFAPVSLELTLEALHQKKLASIIETTDNKEKLFTLLQNGINQILRLFSIRLLLIAALGGMLGAGIVDLSYSSLIKGILVGSLLVFCLIILTYYTYDVTAFKDPNFSGMLEAAPWMVEVIEEGLNDIQQLGYEMQAIADNMSQLFDKVNSLKPLSQIGGDKKVLHVSDIHNNPTALKFIAQIVDSFKVDLVIDTGDITEYGTALEGELLTNINKLEVPYVFVPGNHDSPQIIEQMKKFKNVIVLESNIIKLEELVIAGVSDPAAKSSLMRPLKEKDMQEYSRGLVNLVTSSKVTPDIVAVHQFSLAKSLVGEVPLLLYGHDHEFKIGEEQGTVKIDAGTTGAAGVRGFKTSSDLSNSVVLLHYNKSDDGLRLSIVDIIKFYSRQSGFTLKRKLITN